MEAASTMASFARNTRMLAPLPTATYWRNLNNNRRTSCLSLPPSYRPPPPTSPLASPDSITYLNRSSSPPKYKLKRNVITKVIPYTEGNADEQPPPDLASYLFKNWIVYLGMSLVPSVTELLLAEFLYLQYDDADKPVYLYINSTGTTKGGEKLGYETEAFAIYDVMSYVETPIFTLCVGNAWGEAALLLAAGSKGNRSALPSSTIMIKQPIARFEGQATDVELARKEINNVKAELVSLFSKHVGKSPEQIEADMRRPKYFSPSEAVEYGIIDKVLYNERATEDRGVVSDLKKAQLI